MAWSASSAFRQIYSDIIGNVTAFDWDADTIKVAAFDNTITPDKNVTAANSAYGAGVWASGGASGTNFAATGLTLASKTNDVGTNGQITLDAADNAVTGTTITLYGLLCYDDTLTTPVADQGFGFHYLGGAATVTAGDITLVYHANGLQRITLS
jgi:hypothetical protein